MKTRLCYHLIIGFLACCIFVCFSGCSSGSDSKTESIAENGDLILSLTDAPGDFVSYSVDVLSITLTSANGAVVSTLPLSTRVDFSQYTQMIEFLTAATIPHGAYTKATMTLDYQNADIWVEGENGAAVKVEDIKDEEGQVVTTLEVSVHLENANKVVIAPGLPVHLTLDFDLNASNTVTFGEDDMPQVVVEPVLMAEVDRTGSKIHRLRGALKQVNVNNNTFQVIIRPFVHLISRGEERFGVLHVSSDDDTVYDIDGVLYTGSDGLTALSEMTVHSAVVVIGDMKFHPRRFEAREVYAGGSVPGGDLDVARGNVVSRNGNTIIMKGATLFRENGSVVFNDQITVLLDENTQVRRQLSADDYHINDISVGQRVTVSGELTNSDAAQLEMDATNGFARMLLTTLRGTVKALDDTQPLVMDLQAIDCRQVDIFDFQKTGSDTANDSDPAFYEINTGMLDILALSIDVPVKVLGFVQPFGQSPEDFDAQTVVDISQIKTYMRISWRPADSNPFDTIADGGILINLEDADRFHHVGQDHQVVDLKSLSDQTWIKPGDDGLGVFVINQHQVVVYHADFESFASDLSVGLEEGEVSVKDIFATGFFNDQTVTLTSDYVVVRLK